MKPFDFTFFRVLLGICLACAVQSVRAVGLPPEPAPLHVKVTHPGTLAARVGTTLKYKATALTVEGPLNGTDLCFLRMMAGRDDLGNPTRGQLRKLDLSRATFAAGGAPYLRKDGPLTVTGGPLTLPPYVFSQCGLEEVVLPERMDTIGRGAFERSALRSVRLPEDVVVSSEAFLRCEALAEVIFPRRFVDLMPYCFNGCSALRSVRLHDVQFVSSRAFLGLPGLEEIIFDGTVWHIDGWFVADCPSLRRVEFGGCLLTTGTTFASACPRLEEISFSGITLVSHFGLPEDSPKLKERQVTGYVKRSYDHFFLSPSSDPSRLSTEKLEAAATSVLLAYETPMRRSRYQATGMDEAFYGMAWLLAQNSRNDLALRLLSILARTAPGMCANVATDSVFVELTETPAYRSLARQILPNLNYKELIRCSPSYQTGAEWRASHPRRFVYAAESDTALQRIRHYFQTDYIAGTGDELTRLKNVMFWVHDHIPHNGRLLPKARRTAIDLYEAMRRLRYDGMNARAQAIVLTELYQSLGWPARFVTCQPKMYQTDEDATVVTVVWSFELQKWVMMDASMAAYVTDENGVPLHPGEIRQRMKDGRTLQLNKEANWNYQQRVTHEYYLDNYMAKNLYFLSGYLENRPGVESDKRQDYITLLPEGETAEIGTPTYDDAWFWQRPF